MVRAASYYHHYGATAQQHTDAAGRGGVLCSSPKTDGVVLSVLNGFRQVICFHFAEQTAPRHGCSPVFSSGIFFHASTRTGNAHLVRVGSVECSADACFIHPPVAKRVVL